MIARGKRATQADLENRLKILEEQLDDQEKMEDRIEILEEQVAYLLADKEKFQPYYGLRIWIRIDTACDEDKCDEICPGKKCDVVNCSLPKFR